MSISMRMPGIIRKTMMMMTSGELQSQVGSRLISRRYKPGAFICEDLSLKIARIGRAYKGRRRRK